MTASFNFARMASVSLPSASMSVLKKKSNGDTQPKVLQDVGNSNWHGWGEDGQEVIQIVMEVLWNVLGDDPVQSFSEQVKDVRGRAQAKDKDYGVVEVASPFQTSRCQSAGQTRIWWKASLKSSFARREP
jgi:hypothetical protein